MKKYKLNLETATMNFQGNETRYLNIELLRGEKWVDSLILEKKHILWLLGLREDNEE